MVVVVMVVVVMVVRVVVVGMVMVVVVVVVMVVGVVMVVVVMVVVMVVVTYCCCRCHHFESLGSPLRSIHVFPTVSSQINRYIDKVVCNLTLENCWCSVLMKL